MFQRYQPDPVQRNVDQVPAGVPASSTMWRTAAARGGSEHSPRPDKGCDPPTTPQEGRQSEHDDDQPATARGGGEEAAADMTDGEFSEAVVRRGEECDKEWRGISDKRKR